MFTEEEYEEFIGKVDPDDIKELWQMGSNPDSNNELYKLHDESKVVLDYFGYKEFSDEVAKRLAKFILDLEEFNTEYQERNEYNPKIVEAIDVFLDKAPHSLRELAYEHEE